MSLPVISAAEAKRLLDRGAVLVDIRAADERAREWIPGSRHQALARLADGERVEAGGAVIFHCRSGNRTQGNAAQLAAAAEGCEAYILEGGLEAWKQAGLPLRQDRGQPLELMRQVQIAAGSLALLGVVLGFFVAPGFYALSAFVGGGLILAGVTGWCGMARLLKLMPWNRRLAA